MLTVTPWGLVAHNLGPDGSPGIRTQNLGINLPHRVSPAAVVAATGCGLDHLFALGPVPGHRALGRAAYGL